VGETPPPPLPTSSSSSSPSRVATETQPSSRPVPPPRRSPPKRVGQRPSDAAQRAQEDADDDDDDDHEDDGDDDSSASQTSGQPSTVAPLAEVESDFDATFTPTPQNAVGDAIELPQNDVDACVISGVAAAAAAVDGEEEEDIYMASKDHAWKNPKPTSGMKLDPIVRMTSRPVCISSPTRIKKGVAPTHFVLFRVYIAFISKN